MNFNYHYICKGRGKNLFYAVAEDHTFALKSDEFDFLTLWNNKEIPLNKMGSGENYGKYTYDGPIVEVKEIKPSPVDWIPWFRIEPIANDEYKLTVYENSYEEESGILYTRDVCYGPGTYTLKINRTTEEIDPKTGKSGSKEYTVKYSIDNIPLHLIVE